jgi:poly(hydroxyalkanoate) granule-associated protein
MARKSQAKSPGAADLGEAVLQQAQAIWLAGLGAFGRARTEGDALFEKLVEQGKGLRERARGAADEALSTVRTQADEKVTAAQGQWDKLEQVFEERVQRSLHRLGVMTREEIDDLSRQVQELNQSVQALMKTQGASKPATRKRTAKKPRKAKR